jgi:D-sedoheptulose 7-phosphate isomerase
MAAGAVGRIGVQMEQTSLINAFSVHKELLQKTITNSAEVIGSMIEAVVRCFRHGNKILLCGNGGSAADAQHIAGEFINRFHYDRPALPAIALTTDSSVLTCIANDSEYDNVFSRQVEALGRNGDILIGISTSGGSPNVLKAMETARSRGLLTIGFTGEKGKELLVHLCDLALIVPSTDTPRIQECHQFAWHFICDEVEKEIFPRR